MAAFCKDFLSGDNFEAVLAFPILMDIVQNTPKAGEKIAAEEKDSPKCSLCVIVCCSKTVKKVGY